MSKFVIVVACWATCGALLAAEPYWIAWEGDDFPESQGWTRMWGNWQGPYQGPGAHRTLEAGVLTYDSLYDPGVVDYSYIERPGGIDPPPGHLFVMEWKLKVDQVVGFADPTVGLFTDGAWALGFAFTPDTIYSTFENYLTIPIVAGAWHEYRVVSADMRAYDLFVDSLHARHGTFKPAFSASMIAWGDGAQGAASFHKWDYFRVGVIPEPVSATSVLLFLGTACRRRA